MNAFKVTMLASGSKGNSALISTGKQNFLVDMGISCKMLTSRLKEVGFSESQMNIAKEELETTLNKLKIFVNGRNNIFSDFKGQNHNLEEYKKTISEVCDAFTETTTQLEALETSIKKYYESSPAFITEFLSPQGIMTKKRAIDEKINQNIEKVSNINNEIESLSTSSNNLSQKIEEYKEELAMIIEEVLKQRYQGIKNEKGEKGYERMGKGTAAGKAI